MSTSSAPNLSLPREAWAEHPHYPSQVLLLRSHDGFRRASRKLVEMAQTGERAAVIAWQFHRLKSAMLAHEAYEERKLFPYLEARFGFSCQPLREGHEELDAANEAIFDSLEAAEDAATSAVAEALSVHDAVLIEHLAFEESLVIPALLALSPEEFRRYYHGDIRTLIPAK